MCYSSVITCHITLFITDYFTDVTTFVEAGFCKRVCENVLEELVKRCSSAAVAAFDKGLAAAGTAMGGASGAAAVDAGDVVMQRLVMEERSVQVCCPVAVVASLMSHVALLVCLPAAAALLQPFLLVTAGP